MERWVERAALYGLVFQAHAYHLPTMQLWNQRQLGHQNECQGNSMPADLFSWDHRRARALKFAQLTQKAQPFSLLSSSGLTQQAEGMVPHALLPLSWDCSLNHAKELI